MEARCLTLQGFACREACGKARQDNDVPGVLPTVNEDLIIEFLKYNFQRTTDAEGKTTQVKRYARVRAPSQASIDLCGTQ